MRGEATLQDQDVALQQVLQLGVADVPRRHRIDKLLLPLSV
jgi:hypothetical protein